MRDEVDEVDRAVAKLNRCISWLSAMTAAAMTWHVVVFALGLLAWWTIPSRKLHN